MLALQKGQTIMRAYHLLFRKSIPALLIASLLSVSANADILGFGDFSGFTLNQSDAAAAPSINGGTIHLTYNTPSIEENRSIFGNTPQSIAQFNMSVTYQAGEFQGGGAALVLEDGPSGAHANNNVPDSAIVTLEIGSNSTSGFYDGPGYGGSGSSSTAPVVLNSGDPIDVSLVYNGSILHESLTDTVTSASYSTSFFVDIPSIVGSSTAYVGLLGYTGFGTAGDQYFSNLSFTTVPTPEPSSLALLAIAGALGAIAYIRGPKRA
jgi:PEP-CTERM motif